MGVGLRKKHNNNDKWISASGGGLWKLEICCQLLDNEATGLGDFP